jgi:subtilisin family serine protease
MAYFSKKIACVAIALALASQESTALTNPLKGEKTSQNRRILVRYKSEISKNKKDRGHFSVGAYVIQSFDIPKNLELVEVAKGISVESALEFYKEDPNVLYAEPDYKQYAFLTPPPTKAPAEGEEPSKGKVDPRLKEQWGLNNVGQTGGTVDADINALEMWKNIRGSKSVVLAVIDTGINYKHPDLIKNIWINQGEIPNNNIDDDGNGVVDDVFGYNALEDSGDPMDDHGHGSHCAGVIGAEGQNTFGGSGVMQEATIIGCRFLARNGEGSTSGAIACLDYLRDLKTRSKNPVDIFATSNSWGGGPASEALRDAIQAHQDEGILFLAASSNDGENNDYDYMQINYPSSYPLANIVAVASTNHSDELSWFSNYGKRTVHVGAPGEDILSTVLGRGYESMSGTSMATPFTAGLAGMIKAYYPDYNYMQVKNLLMAGGTPLRGLANRTVSGRRIRAWDTDGTGSLTCKDQIVSGRLSPSQDVSLVPVGETVLLSALNINCEKANGEIIIDAIPEQISLLDNGEGIDSAAHDGMYSEKWVAPAKGRYEFIFPDDDLVVINVYDPAEFLPYERVKEKDFNYREFDGTMLETRDEWTGKVNVPFPVYFGGSEQSFNELALSSNGALSFTDTKMFSMENEPLPSEEFVSLIAPLWDDLDPTAGDGGIFYETLGKAPNREFVVEYRDVYQFGSDEGATFQVVFFENSSDILFNYLDVDFGSTEFDNGASATIGVQTTKEHKVEIGFDSPSVKSYSAIRFQVAH